MTGLNLDQPSSSFNPQIIRSDNSQSDIGTAGSTSLVLQTIYLPLSLASKSSRIILVGGTHVPFAPTFDWLNLHWMNYLKLIGFDCKLDLEFAGFYPRGGGRIYAKINPVEQLNWFGYPGKGFFETNPGNLICCKS